MRPIILSNATKVLIAAFALILSFGDFAEARDRSGDQHFVRRPHFERQHRPRSETLAGVTERHRYYYGNGRYDGHDRRRGRNRLVGRTDNRRYFEGRYGYGRPFDRRYGFDRRPNRQIVVREFNGQGANYWEPVYGGNNFPTATSEGTYFGGLSAWSDPGNGTYFRSEGSGYGYYGGDTNGAYIAPRGKIIRVNPSTAGRACEWEAGVCVIRR